MCSTSRPQPEALFECVSPSRDMATRPAHKAGEDFCDPSEHTCTSVQGAAQLGPTNPTLLAGDLLPASCRNALQDSLKRMSVPLSQCRRSWAPFGSAEPSPRARAARLAGNSVPGLPSASALCRQHWQALFERLCQSLPTQRLHNLCLADPFPPCCAGAADGELHLCGRARACQCP